MKTVATITLVLTALGILNLLRMWVSAKLRDGSKAAKLAEVTARATAELDALGCRR